MIRSNIDSEKLVIITNIFISVFLYNKVCLFEAHTNKWIVRIYSRNKTIYIQNPDCSKTIPKIISLFNQF